MFEETITEKDTNKYISSVKIFNKVIKHLYVLDEHIEQTIHIEDEDFTLSLRKKIIPQNKPYRINDMVEIIAVYTNHYYLTNKKKKKEITTKEYNKIYKSYSFFIYDEKQCIFSIPTPLIKNKYNKTNYEFICLGYWFRFFNNKSIMLLK